MEAPLREEEQAAPQVKPSLGTRFLNRSWRRTIGGLVVSALLVVLFGLVRLLEPSTAEGDALVTVGMDHFNAGRYANAARELERALAAPATTEPRSDVLMARGVSLNKLKRFPEAVTALEEAVSLDRANRPAWTALGVAHAGARQFDRATNAYQRALSLQPADVDTLISIGALEFRRTGDARRAIPLFKRATDANPQSMLAWFNLSAMALTAGDCETAVSAGLKARDTGMANFDELAAKLTEKGCALPQ